MISKNIFKRRDDEVYISTYFINRTFSYSNSCIKCHKEIEHIRDPKSKMMQDILDMAERQGKGE